MFRDSVRRTAILACLLAGGMTPVACGSILGIDDGSPLADASSDGGGPEDSPFVDTGSPATDSGGGGGDAGSTGDAPSDHVAMACDGGDYCKTHCGGTDMCGQGCSDNCSTAAGWSCSASTSMCTCTHDPSWCTNRCGTITDNCGQSFDCGPCDGGACVPDANPCATQGCGTATDSCGGPTLCGNNGACENGDICESNNSCCQPFGNPCSQPPGYCNSAPNGCGSNVACNPTCPISGEVCGSGNECSCPSPSCNGACNTTVTNSCGASTPCPGTCPSGVCDPTAQQCCVVNLQSCVGNPCGENNCHLPCGGAACDGGACLPGTPCTSDSECCPAASSCTSTGMDSGACQALSCMGDGGACSSTDECCYPLNCTGGLMMMEDPFAGGGPDGGVGAGTCQ